MAKPEPQPAARDVVQLPLAEKNRPAVVLDILSEEQAFVIYGTGTARDLPRLRAIAQLPP